MANFMIGVGIGSLMQQRAGVSTIPYAELLPRLMRQRYSPRLGPGLPLRDAYDTTVTAAINALPNVTWLPTANAEGGNLIVAGNGTALQTTDFDLGGYAPYFRNAALFVRGTAPKLVRNFHGSQRYLNSGTTIRAQDSGGEPPIAWFDRCAVTHDEIDYQGNTSCFATDDPIVLVILTGSRFWGAAQDHIKANRPSRYVAIDCYVGGTTMLREFDRAHADPWTMTANAGTVFALVTTDGLHTALHPALQSLSIATRGVNNIVRAAGVNSLSNWSPYQCLFLSGDGDIYGLTGRAEGRNRALYSQFADPATYAADLMGSNSRRWFDPEASFDQGTGAVRVRRSFANAGTVFGTTVQPFSQGDCIAEWGVRGVSPFTGATGDWYEIDPPEGADVLSEAPVPALDLTSAQLEALGGAAQDQGVRPLVLKTTHQAIDDSSKRFLWDGQRIVQNTDLSIVFETPSFRPLPDARYYLVRLAARWRLPADSIDPETIGLTCNWGRPTRAHADAGRGKATRLAFGASSAYVNGLWLVDTGVSRALGSVRVGTLGGSNDRRWRSALLEVVPLVQGAPTAGAVTTVDLATSGDVTLTTTRAGSKVYVSIAGPIDAAISVTGATAIVNTTSGSDASLDHAYLTATADATEPGDVTVSVTCSQPVTVTMVEVMRFEDGDIPVTWATPTAATMAIDEFAASTVFPMQDTSFRFDNDGKDVPPAIEGTYSYGFADIRFSGRVTDSGGAGVENASVAIEIIETSDWLHWMRLDMSETVAITDADGYWSINLTIPEHPTGLAMRATARLIHPTLDIQDTQTNAWTIA